MHEILVECWNPECPTPKFTCRLKIPPTDVARLALNKAAAFTRDYMEKFKPAKEEYTRKFKSQDDIFRIPEQPEFEMSKLDEFLKQKLDCDVDVTTQTTRFKTAVCPSGHINKIPLE